MALGEQFKVQNLVTLCQLFLERALPESRQESDNDKCFHPLGAFTCYTGHARRNTDEIGHATVSTDETGHVRINNDESGHARVDNDETGHATINTDETGRANVNNDETGHARFNNDESEHATINTEEVRHARAYTNETEHASFNTDGAGHAKVLTDETGYDRLNNDETGHASLNTCEAGHDTGNTDKSGRVKVSKDETVNTKVNTDESGYVRVNTDESGHTRVNTDESGHARVNTDESGHARVNTDESGHASVNTDESGRARVNTDESGHARVNTDESGHASVNTDESGHARVNTDESGHARVNTDESGHVRVNTDESGHARVSTDESGHARVNTDESGHARVNTDEIGNARVKHESGHARVNKHDSGHARFNTDASGHARVNTDESGRARVNTDENGHARVNTDESGHAKVNTDASGHARVNTDASGHARVNTVESGHARVNTDESEHNPDINISLQKPKPGSGLASVNRDEAGHARDYSVKTGYIGVNTSETEHADVTHDTSDEISSGIPEENLSPQKLKSVNDSASNKSSRALILEFRRRYEIEKEPISVEVMHENNLKQNFVKSDTAKSLHEDVLMSNEDGIERRYVRNETTKSVDIKFQIPRQDSKQKRLESVLRSQGVVLPKNSLTIYAKNKLVTLKNLENIVVNKLLGKTTQKGQLDILSSADHEDDTQDVKYQRLRYVFTGKSSAGKHVGEAILGTTSMEHCFRDKDSMNISQDRYLGNNISQNTGQKTSVPKPRCSESPRKKSRKQSEKDVFDTESQEQTPEKPSSKVKTQKRRRRRKTSGKSSPHLHQGQNMSVGEHTPGDLSSKGTTPKRQRINKILQTSGDSSSKVTTHRRQKKMLGSRQPDQIYDISEETIEYTSKAATLRRKPIAGLSSPHTYQGSDVLDTDSHGQSRDTTPGLSCDTTPGRSCDTTSCRSCDTSNIMVPSTKLVCDNLVEDISGCDVSIDVKGYGSGSCNRNINDANMTSASIDSNNDTTIQSAVHDNHNSIKAGIGEEHSKLIVTEDCSTDIQPVISDKNRSHVVREISDLDRQIRNLQADLMNNHGYQEDNDGFSNCQDECMIVGVEGDENPSNVHPTARTEDGKVAASLDPTSTAQTEDGNVAASLDPTSTALLESDQDESAAAFDLESTIKREIEIDEMTASLTRGQHHVKV
ncbi:uncharacterized protein LOC117315372 [Pecten maximus]|uniref:uncharacterized protein LOC117315372 n=1 Tax=Pecten maximus TaxID=6579 RepID=UPI00145861BE|nr:uncharacterized protein LOC117315372 [Pecten maximus]